MFKLAVRALQLGVLVNDLEDELIGSVGEFADGTKAPRLLRAEADSEELKMGQ